MKTGAWAVAVLLCATAFAQEKLSVDTVLVPGGTFLMGSPQNESWREADEVQHPVTLDSFYISRYEVTQELFEAVTGRNPSAFRGAQLPVESVTWLEAVAFCNALSERDGLSAAYTVDGETVTWNQDSDGWRLPTEAEWEYTARAGRVGPFCTKKAPGDSDANFYAHYPYNIEQNYFNSSALETKPGCYRQRTVEAGSFAPNAFGLYDVHGNVAEWCFDIYGAYPAGAVKNPSGAQRGSSHVCRGGGWNDFGKHLRCAYRSSQLPDDASASRGFRLARSAAKRRTAETRQ